MVIDLLFSPLGFIGLPVLAGVVAFALHWFVGGTASSDRPLVVLVLLFIVLGFGLALSRYWLPYGPLEEVTALAVAGDRVLVVDRRTIAGGPNDESGDSTSSRVLRVRAFDPDTGEETCRTLAGLNARALGVFHDELWFAAAGYRSTAQWSLATLVAVSPQDCSTRELLERGWSQSFPELGGNLARREWIDDGTLVVVSGKGEAFRLAPADRSLTPLDDEALEQALHPPPTPPPSLTLLDAPPPPPATFQRRQGFSGSDTMFHFGSAGRGAGFARLQRLVAGTTGAHYKPVNDDIWIQPHFILPRGKKALTLVSTAQQKGGALQIAALEESGRVRWSIPLDDWVDVAAPSSERDVPVGIEVPGGFVLTFDEVTFMITPHGELRWTD